MFIKWVLPLLGIFIITCAVSYFVWDVYDRLYILDNKVKVLNGSIIDHEIELMRLEWLTE